MFSRSRIGGKTLAQLCYRLGTSLEAGVDLRKALARESERGSPDYQQQIHRIQDRIAAGATLADALSAASGFFPPLVCDMVGLGEATGKLAEVLLRLAEHYEGRLQLRRVFLTGIAWPLLQLVIAILVIGLLIWILGFVGNTDILGFGLTGTAGVLKYFACVAVFVFAIAIVVRGAMRGWFWSRPLQHFLMRVPVLGPSLKTVALSRIAWTMSLTFNSGMDAQRAIQLSLGSAGNAVFTDRTEEIERYVVEGGSVLRSAANHRHLSPRIPRRTAGRRRKWTFGGDNGPPG